MAHLNTVAKPTQATTKPQCSVCQQTFNTNKSLVEHCVLLGHDAELCCQICFRKFGSRGAAAAHKSSPVHLEPEVTLQSAPSLTLQTSHDSETPSWASPQDSTSSQMQYEDDEITQSQAATNPYVPTGRARGFLSYHMVYGGNTYTLIPPFEQHVIIQKMESSCHSLTCLQKARYILDGEMGLDPENRRKPIFDITKFLPTPSKTKDGTKRQAVVLDCEMAGIQGGFGELIKLSVVDFLTGEILIDSLVEPSAPIVQWRTRIHGISAAIISAAVARNEVLKGWEAARTALWDYIDGDTILIGQSLHHDLHVLRTFHRKIVDSAIITSEAVFGEWNTTYRMWGLKNLCNGILGLKIREDGPTGKKIHDSLEDVFASRELVLQCMKDDANLKVWASKKQKEIQGKAAEEATPDRRKKGRVEKRTRKGFYIAEADIVALFDSEDDDYVGWMSGDEPLRWEDIVEFVMWPKSPPNWSD
ncbi:RNA exonuclease 3 [Cladobotryum mycophilum]|uniref:RNA exonuclease 3 n=1 Tax=Cladobotryum mycophilum TaxID=491253 RepID=A0ABR0SJB9_9HYPO